MCRTTFNSGTSQAVLLATSYISTGVLCDKSNTRSKLSRDFMCAVCVLVRPSSPAAVTPNTPIPGYPLKCLLPFAKICGFV